jgi:hypothetical protein
MKEAAKKKDEGNGYFSKGDYAKAEELFTEAIAMTEALDFTKPEMVDARKKRAVFFNNRSYASPPPPRRCNLVHSHCVGVVRATRRAFFGAVYCRGNRETKFYF